MLPFARLETCFFAFMLNALSFYATDAPSVIVILRKTNSIVCCKLSKVAVILRPFQQRIVEGDEGPVQSVKARQVTNAGLVPCMCGWGHA